MNSKCVKSSGTSCRGRAAGHGSTLFSNALHEVYDKACGKSTSTGTPIFVGGPCGLQRAGHVVSIDGTRILRKTKVSHSRHFCRRHQGYGVELDALRQAEKLGARAVRLEFADSTRILEASFATIAEYGVRDTLGGFGEQCFLPLDYWREVQS